MDNDNRKGTRAFRMTPQDEALVDIEDQLLRVITNLSSPDELRPFREDLSLIFEDALDAIDQKLSKAEE